MHNYNKLHIWQDGINLARRIYEITAAFPPHEKYGIVSQMTRAAVSIPSNIAEGSGRNSQKDQAHFYNIAYGSLMEVFSQLDIACDLGYISQEEFNQLESLINEEAKMLSGLIAKRKQPIAQRPKTYSVASSNL